MSSVSTLSDAGSFPFLALLDILLFIILVGILMLGSSGVLYHEPTATSALKLCEPMQCIDLQPAT